MAEFNANLASQRQAALCRWIGDNLRDNAGAHIKPLGEHSSLDVPMRPLDLRIWATDRLCDIALWAVANRVDSGLLDHAWAFGYRQPPHEPWGFVGEPYADFKDVERSARRRTRELAGWGVEARALPAEQSSWNPGRCPPLVVWWHGDFAEFVRSGVAEMLDLRVPRWRPDHRCGLGPRGGGRNRELGDA